MMYTDKYNNNNGEFLINPAKSQIWLYLTILEDPCIEFGTLKVIFICCYKIRKCSKQ